MRDVVCAMGATSGVLGVRAHASAHDDEVVGTGRGPRARGGTGRVSGSADSRHTGPQRRDSTDTCRGSRGGSRDEGGTPAGDAGGVVRIARHVFEGWTVVQDPVGRVTRDLRPRPAPRVVGRIVGP
ncbi:hypothetical protein Cph01nite_14960 [Cellulomonas phragmiteti]|uniref:Uncharacterized protein n=1 Tax=Cellulomonas phragmiteti TaxID=478780 RepID=A0ABQ4DK69_9CELL|nr:hypothetical protein Cph01nite_14960 [Cellulomonas phragmiteti]